MQESRSSLWFLRALGAILIVASLYYTCLAVLHHRVSSVVLFQNGCGLLVGLCFLLGGFQQRLACGIAGVGGLFCQFGVGAAKWRRGEDTLGGAIYPWIAVVAVWVVMFILWRRSRRSKNGA